MTCGRIQTGEEDRHSFAAGIVFGGEIELDHLNHRFLRL